MWTLSYKAPLEEDKLERSPKPLSGDPFLGSVDAPVTVIEVADIRCPGCKFFFENVEPQLQHYYIKKGLVKFYFWDMIIDSVSENTSQATWCANDQGKYEEYRNLILVRSDSFDTAGPRSNYSSEYLVKMAEELGLERSAFSTCLESEKHLDRLNERYLQGQALNPNVFPTVFVDGRRLADGRFLFAEIGAEVEKSLAKQKESNEVN